VGYGCRREVSATQIATAIAAANSNFGAVGSINSDRATIAMSKQSMVPNAIMTASANPGQL
jgi:hypothetical protein